MFGALLEVKMFKKCTPLWREAHVKVKMDKTRPPRNKLLTKHMSKSKCTKHHMFRPLLDVEVSFCVAGARDSPPAKNEQNVSKREGFVAFPKTMAGVGHLKRICKSS